MKDLRALLIHMVLVDGCAGGQEMGIERGWDLRWRHTIVPDGDKVFWAKKMF